MKYGIYVRRQWLAWEGERTPKSPTKLIFHKKFCSVPKIFERILCTFPFIWSSIFLKKFETDFCFNHKTDIIFEIFEKKKCDFMRFIWYESI